MTKRALTKKQGIILMLLYCFRFLNSKQIQEFLGHKDHRRINAWLKDLSEKEYIKRDFKPIYGVLTKPAVCYLAIKGRGLIRNGYRYHFATYLKRIARDNKASKAFRIRCQIIADWYLMLLPPVKRKSGGLEKGMDEKREETEKPNINRGKTKTNIDIINYVATQLKTDIPENIEEFPINTLQFFTPSYFPSFTLLEKIKPDAYVRKKTTDGIMHGLLFVLDAYIPRMMLRYLLQRIFTALDEETWEEDSIYSIEFFVLCPNNMIIIYLKRLLPSFLEKYYVGKPLQFHFATRNQLYKQKNGDAKNIKWLNFSSTED